MGDKIYIDTELLRQISSQLSQVHHSLSGIQQKLSNSVSEVGRVVSDQVGLINVLSAVQKNTQKDSDYTERLAKAVNNAAARWEEVERRLANQQIQGSETAPQGTGVETGAGTITWFGNKTGAVMGGWIGAGMGMMLGPLMHPESVGFSFFKGAYEGAKLGAQVGAENDPGTGLDYTYKKGEMNWREFLFPKEAGNYSKEEYEAKNGILFAKGSIANSSFKRTNMKTYSYGEYTEKEGLEKESIRIPGGGLAYELNVGQLERGFRGKDGELTQKSTLGGLAFSGDVGATLFKDKGHKPDIGINALGDVYVMRDEISGKYGTENVNIYGGQKVSFLGGRSVFQLGYVDDKEHGGKKFGINSELGAEAYYAKLELKAGADLYGVKVDVTGTSMIGAGLSAGAKANSNSVGGKIGAGPVKIMVNVDGSKALERFFSKKP